MDEEFVFIASLTQQERFSRLTPEALHLQPLIAFESGSGTRALIDGWFAACGLAIAPVMQLGSIEAIKRMVRAGLVLYYPNNGRDPFAEDLILTHHNSQLPLQYGFKRYDA